MTRSNGNETETRDTYHDHPSLIGIFCQKRVDKQLGLMSFGVVYYIIEAMKAKGCHQNHNARVQLSIR